MKIIVALLLALAPLAAAAQTYPTKPVKIIVPAQPGGGLDVVVRGIGKNGLAADVQLHFCETFSARSRSSIRSCGSSRPIERRTVPAVMAAFFRSSSLMR